MNRLSFLWVGLVLFGVLPTGCEPSPRQEWSLSSPDGTLKVTVANRREAGDGPVVLRYRLERLSGDSTIEVLGWSPLGIVREDADFSQNLEFSGKEQRAVEDHYTMLRGKRRQIDRSAQQLILHFRTEAGKQMELIWRAYDDGAAFRYRFPEQSEKPYTLAAEHSGFQLPAGGRAWLQPYDSIGKWTPAYERYFEQDIPVGAPAPGAEGWCFPALFTANGQWLLLSESDLDSTYFGSHLQPEAPGGRYTLRPPEAAEAEGLGTVMPTSTLPWQTPWRVLITGPGLGAIVESTLITDLARPPVLADTSWIRPGRASWSWWSDHPSSTDFNKLKDFVDLAAEMGWEYSLVDANWNVMEGGTLEALAAYADQKNVGLLLWYNSGGPHNTVEEQPRNRLLDGATRRAEFARLQQLGIRGVKVDFFQSDKPLLIKQYLDILRDAADFHLLVNFHGCTIPRGWDRTYPHLMAMEAVKGAEAYSFDPTYPANAPAQNTLFAFTRNVIGPMDYTPVTFSDNVFPHLTSVAHELALAVVFESGILHLADRVSAYQGMPELIYEVLRTIPVTWEETHFLGGSPGKDYLVARRHGETWYVAGINGEKETKEFTLSLPFLGPRAVSEIWVGDGPTPRTFDVKTNAVNGQDPLPVSLSAYGGFLLKIYPSD